jgi:hypothetical protein
MSARWWLRLVRKDGEVEPGPPVFYAHGMHGGTVDLEALAAQFDTKRAAISAGLQADLKLGWTYHTFAAEQVPRKAAHT